MADAGADGGAEEQLRGKGRTFVVMGAPASGKGTQCKLLAEKFGFVHLSTGDMFRDITQRGTELGLRAKEFIDNGSYVPDDLVLSLVMDRLSHPDVLERGCLLDGFPRTAEQAEALQRQVRIDGVFFLQVPDKALLGRAADRRIDPETGAIYHLKHLPPPEDVVPRLVRRDRDDEPSFRQRIDVFKRGVRRVLPMFSGQAVNIDGSLEPNDVFENLVRAMQGVSSRSQQLEAGRAAAKQTCAICFDSPADFLVVPCGHQCGCEECLTAVQLHSGRCPICRGTVQAIQRVFQCGAGCELAATDLAVKPKTVTTHADLEDKLDGNACANEEDEWSDDGAEVEPENVSLVVQPCEDAGEDGSVCVAVSARLPEAARREPADVCCVIDVSGSMGTFATYETEDGEVKNDGLSVLDIVKHATKTVLKALHDDDRLAIVAFNDVARTALELTPMTTEGQDKAIEALDGLHAGNQTNIWAGLLAAMEALRAGLDPKGPGRQGAILLLTDGQPNRCPPRGHVTELRDYKDTHPHFTVQLNTFGFGYSLDSELLLDLAAEGNGTCAFIPDAVIVGTTFVNSVANVLSTLSQSATLSLMPRGGAELAGPVMGSFSEQQESWGRSVSLGPLQYGQARDVVVPLRLPETGESGEPYLEVVMTYPRSNGSSGRAACNGTSRIATVDAVVARCRADLVSTGYEAIADACKNKGKEAGVAVAQMCNRLQAAKAAVAHLQGEEESASLAALLADAEGRMSKALKGKDRFNRWGKHYLRALTRAHQLQVCTNFMDPGLQPYGGELFRSLREAGDQIFLSLPPPRPSRAPARPTGNCSPTGPPSPNMNTYYAGAGGGCFAPTSSVELEAGAHVPLSAVLAGDRLRVVDGGFARVVCVARIARDLHKGLLSLPGGLRITPRHPVRIGGTWKLPRDVPEASTTACESGYVINVVLERCHVLLVDGVECATWGHGLEGEVVGHSFYGTGRVLDALSSLPGWQSGFVEVAGRLRDAKGNIVGLLGTCAGSIHPGLGLALPELVHLSSSL